MPKTQQQLADEVKAAKAAAAIEEAEARAIADRNARMRRAAQEANAAAKKMKQPKR